jgi:hypothetical protein
MDWMIGYWYFIHTTLNYRQLQRCRYGGLISHIKSSLHCRTFNSQLNPLDSSLICQLPTPELSIQFSLQSSTFECQFSTDSQYNHFARTEKKTRFQTYSCFCVFTDRSFRNGFSYCCVHVHFQWNLFTKLLRSNELFRLIDIMSQYLWFCHLWVSVGFIYGEYIYLATIIRA